MDLKSLNINVAYCGVVLYNSNCKEQIVRKELNHEQEVGFNERTCGNFASA